CESLFFFFQAEDGIRDDLVTGVQTCDLPILQLSEMMAPSKISAFSCTSVPEEMTHSRTSASAPMETLRQRMALVNTAPSSTWQRSEERRVGKERRAAIEAQYSKNRITE